MLYLSNLTFEHNTALKYTHLCIRYPCKYCIEKTIAAIERCKICQGSTVIEKLKKKVKKNHVSSNLFVRLDFNKTRLPTHIIHNFSSLF